MSDAQQENKFVRDLEDGTGNEQVTQSLQMQFGQNIANPTVSVRNKEIRQLREWVSKQKCIKDNVLRKISYGLFYAMWLCDNEIKQEDLAVVIADILQFFQPIDADLNTLDSDYSYLKRYKSPGVAFLYSFVAVLQVNWYKMDKHRMDKFYFLIKQFIKSAFSLATATQNSEETRLALLQSLVLLYTETIPEHKTPDSIKYYFIDNFVSILAELGADKDTATAGDDVMEDEDNTESDVLTSDETNLFLGAFLDIYSTLNMSPIVRSKIESSIIQNLLNQEIHQFKFFSTVNEAEEKHETDESTECHESDELEDREGCVFSSKYGYLEEPVRNYLTIDWGLFQGKLVDLLNSRTVPKNVKEMLVKIRESIQSMIGLVFPDSEDESENSCSEVDEEDSNNESVTEGKKAEAAMKISIKSLMDASRIDMSSMVTSHGRAKLDSFVESLVMAGFYKYEELSGYFQEHFILDQLLDSCKINVAHMIAKNNSITIDDIFQILVDQNLVLPDTDIENYTAKYTALDKRNCKLSLEEFMEKVELKKIRYFVNTTPIPSYNDVIMVSPKVTKRLINDFVTMLRPKRAVDFGQKKVLSNKKSEKLTSTKSRKRSVAINLKHNKVLEFNKKLSISSSCSPSAFDPTKRPIKGAMKKTILKKN